MGRIKKTCPIVLIVPRMVSEPEMASSEGAEKWSVCADNCMKWLVTIIFRKGSIIF